MLTRVMLYSSSGQHEVARRLASLAFTIQCVEGIGLSANLLALVAIGVVAVACVRP
jgi:hypothetical protein